MHCGFAAAGMGYRPENSDKETTSLGTPMLPTSGGLNRPACLPEAGPPQTNDLDFPASAPTAAVCSQEKSSQAETLNPRAAKQADSLHERSPDTLESHELLPWVRDLPEDAAAAFAAQARASLAQDAKAAPCHGPRLPPPPRSEKATVWNRLWKSEDVQSDALGAETPDGLGRQGTSSNNYSRAEELGFPSLTEQLEEPQVGLSKTRAELEREEPDSGEHLCPMALSPPASPAELSPGSLFSEERAGIRWERWIPPAEKRWPELVEDRRGPRGGGACVEVAEEPFVAMDSLLSRPGTTRPGGEAGCSRMEVETSQSPSPLPAGSPAACDSAQRGGGTASEPTGAPAAAGPMEPSCRDQPSDQTEEPCISLTSALKELHQLLVVNSKQDLKASQHEEDLSASVQEQATGRKVHQEEPPEPTSLEPLSFPGGTGVESLVKSQAESTGMTEMYRLASSQGKDMLTAQETSPGFLSLPAFPSQAQAGEHVEEIWSQHPSSRHILGGEASEQSQPPPCHPLAQSPPQSSFSESMETSEALETDFPTLMNELSESSPPLPPDRSPQFLLSHPDGVDHLLDAGFLPLEIVEALERAGGNVELALLILLARNIVVPT